jgi:hypothetical protein
MNKFLNSKNKNINTNHFSFTNMSKKEEIQISTDFTNSIDKLSQMAIALQKKSLEFKEEIKRDYIRFEDMKLNYKKEQEIMERRGTIDEEVVELNVGGETFTTFRSTLLKAENSMLSAMFSGKFTPGSFQNF